MKRRNFFKALAAAVVAPAILAKEPEVNIRPETIFIDDLESPPVETGPALPKGWFDESFAATSTDPAEAWKQLFERQTTVSGPDHSILVHPENYEQIKTAYGTMNIIKHPLLAPGQALLISDAQRKFNFAHQAHLKDMERSLFFGSLKK